MINDNIELKNCDGLVQKVKSKAIKKIKFKPLSFARISSRWKNFLLRRLDKKLDKAKEKLTSIEIPADYDKNKMDKKILKKSNSVARLEASINFLRTGKTTPKEDVKSRAIKLKDNMINNLQYNCDYAYSVLPENAANIFEEPNKTTVNNENPTSNNKINEDDVQQKVADSVQKIMQEQQESKQTPSVQPNRQEIKDAVDKIFEEQAKNNNNNNTTNNTGTIDKNDIMNEINGVKISTNKSKPARISPFIKEDGTYHIKGTDIDDELRYTHVDLKNYNYTPKFNTQQVGVGAISPIDPFKANFEDLPVPKKAEIDANNVGLNDDIFGQTEKKDSLPVELVSNKREIPIVVPERNSDKANDKFKFVDTAEIKDNEINQPAVEKTNTIDNTGNDNLHFDYSNASVQDLTRAVDKVKNMDEISALFQRVQMLKKEQEATEAAVEAATKSAEDSENAYRQTVDQFRAYGDSLEAACNENQKIAEEKRNIAKANEDKINMMMEVMGSMMQQSAQPSRKGK